MNENKEKKKSPSWTAIIVWFIFFWPVSVYLLWKRLTTDKSAAMNKGKTLMGFGIFFLFAAVVMLFNGSDISSKIFGFLFYGIGGGLMLWQSLRMKKTGEEYKKYINIVVNQQQTTIENIASAMGKSYEQTTKDLQKMIDKGYFEGAYIDVTNHEIVLKKTNQDNMGTTNVSQGENVVIQKTKVVKCPNCGGNNTIVIGVAAECDFCGSPIQ